MAKATTKINHERKCGNCNHLQVTFSSAYCRLNAFDFCLDSDRKTEPEHYWSEKK
jgi:hypothetical protein